MITLKDIIISGPFSFEENNFSSNLNKKNGIEKWMNYTEIQEYIFCYNFV